MDFFGGEEGGPGGTGGREDREGRRGKGERGIFTVMVPTSPQGVERPLLHLQRRGRRRGCHHFFGDGGGPDSSCQYGGIAGGREGGDGLHSQGEEDEGGGEKAGLHDCSFCFFFFFVWEFDLAGMVRILSVGLFLGKGRNCGTVEIPLKYF